MKTGRGGRGERVGWTVALLTLIYTFGFIDRQVLAALAQPIKADLALTDGELGLLGGLAFAVLNAAASLPLARIAERRGRSGVITIGVVVWSLMTALCGVAGNFWQLFLLRMGVGVGEAVQPAITALIADKVRPERRASALAFYNLSIPLGAFLGASGGGLIAATVGWRWAFVAAGAPGLLLALLFRLTVRDVVRPPQAARADIPSIGAVARHLLQRRSLVHAVIGIIIATFCVFGIQYFLPAWLMRRHGFSAADAGMTLGLLSSVPAMLSMLAGGLLADRLARRDARWYLWLPVILLSLVVPIYLLALPQADWRMAVAGLALVAFLQYSQTPLLSAIVQNMVGDGMRATASALVGILVGLLSSGLGPLFVGTLSDALTRRAYGGNFALDCAGQGTIVPACQTAASQGLSQAMMVTACLFLWSVVHLLLAARDIRADLARSGWRG